MHPDLKKKEEELAVCSYSITGITLLCSQSTAFEFDSNPAQFLKGKKKVLLQKKKRKVIKAVWTGHFRRLWG